MSDSPDSGQSNPDVGARSVRRARRWPLALAALGVVAVAVAAAIVVAARDHGASGIDQREPVADSPPAQAADLIVKDGVTVEVTGMIAAEPGKPVKVCHPGGGSAAFGSAEPADERNAAAVCGFGVTVTGVDLDRLTEPSESNGVRYGFTTLRGTWRGDAPGGSIKVAVQSAPSPPAPRSGGHPVRPPPCPEPAGGWPPGTGDLGAIYPYVYGHADQFRHPELAHPGSGQELTVLVVEVVTGDVDQARRDLQGLYPGGNLCVTATPDKLSIAQQGALGEPIMRAVHALAREQDAGVFSTSGLRGGLPGNIGGVNDDHFWIELAMVTPRIHDALAPLGFEHIGFRPWIHPVR